MTTEILDASADLPMLREAARILRHIVDQVQGITPMPDGRVSIDFDSDYGWVERLCMWGAAREDDEDEIEDDARDLPKLAADGVSLVEVAPAVREMVRLREAPAALVALAERIAA